MRPHAHMESIAYVTGCLLCGKSYDQVIEKTVAYYLHQTAEQGEAVMDRVSKHNAFLDGLQSGVSTFKPRGVSQAAACHSQVYTVNYGSPHLRTQANLLPLFED